MAWQSEDKTIFIGKLFGKRFRNSITWPMIDWSSKFIAISMLTCDVLAVSPNLQSVCAPTSTQESIDEATRVERLIMGMFVSAAIFEFSELYMTLPSFSSTEKKMCAVVIIVTIYHSLRLRSTRRTVSTLVSNLSKGSLLYALSLFGMSSGRPCHPFCLIWLRSKQSLSQTLSLFHCRYAFSMRSAITRYELLMQVSYGQSGIIDV